MLFLLNINTKQDHRGIVKNECGAHLSIHRYHSLHLPALSLSLRLSFMRYIECRNTAMMQQNYLAIHENNSHRRSILGITALCFFGYIAISKPFGSIMLLYFVFFFSCPFFCPTCVCLVVRVYPHNYAANIYFLIINVCATSHRSEKAHFTRLAGCSIHCGPSPSLSHVRVYSAIAGQFADPESGACGNSAHIQSRRVSHTTKHSFYIIYLNIHDFLERFAEFRIKYGVNNRIHEAVHITEK